MKTLHYFAIPSDAAQNTPRKQGIKPNCCDCFTIHKNCSNKPKRAQNLVSKTLTPFESCITKIGAQQTHIRTYCNSLIFHFLGQKKYEQLVTQKTEIKFKGDFKCFTHIVYNFHVSALVFQFRLNSKEVCFSYGKHLQHNK